MRTIKTIVYELPVLVILLSLLSLTLFKVTAEHLPTQLSYAMGVALICSIIRICIMNAVFKITWPDVFITGFVIYRLVMCYTQKDYGVSIGIQATLFMFGVYVAGRIAFQQEGKGRYLFTLLFFLCGIYEAWIGLGQLYGGTPSGHGIYRVTGTFFNPGPYSCYLAMVAAYAGVYVYKNYAAFMACYRNKEWRALVYFDYGLMPLAALALFVVLMVLPGTLSRAAIVAVGVMFFIACLKRLSRKTILACVAGFSLFGIALYFLKQGSADARVLIWRVSLNIIKEYGLWGVGEGQFLGTYARGQQQFFQENPGSQLLSVASNPDFPFNEYLRLGVETGIVGLLLFMVIVGMACYGYYKAKDEMGYSLGAMLVFSFFSYPFSLFPYQILVALLVAGGVKNNAGVLREKTSRIVTVTTVLILLLITPWGIDTLTKRDKAMKAYKELAYFTKLGLEENLDKEYAPLQSHLRDVPGFYFDYGKYLQQIGEYNQSNHILKEGMKISSDPMFYNVMGNNYKAMGADSLARKAYQTAFEIVPNRIYPLYLTFKLYKERGNQAEALLFSRRVIDFDPKVESPATREIKQEAIHFLDSLQHNLTERIL